MNGKEQVLFVCLAAASAIPGAAGAAFSLSEGGGYELDSSVVDNGGGRWLGGGEYASRAAIGQSVTPVATETGGVYINRSGFYGKPYLTYQSRLPCLLALNSGVVSISLPARAVTDREMFDIGINRQDLRSEFIVDMDKVEEANRKMVAEEGAWAQSFVSDLTEMYIFDEYSLTRDPLVKTGALTLKYRDDDNDWIVDGSNPPVRVGTLVAWVLDEKSDLWVMLPGQGINPENKSMTFGFRGPGVYNMIGTLATDVGRIISYPVPFRPNGPQAGSGAGQTGTAADGITFSNVPTPGYAGSQTGKISIYTLDGQLVKEIDIATQHEIGKVKWNVRNSAGSKVASGVYIWRATCGANSKTGKLMVIW